MFYRILIKDLKHKWGVNVILFLFMTLATVFVASSVNNILVISNATNYCMEKGGVGEVYVSTFEAKGEKTLGDWLEGNKLVKNYSKNEAFILSTSNVLSFHGRDGSEYKINGLVMLQKQWQDNMFIYDNEGNLVNLNDGEIGMQQKELDRNGLKVGDTIRMKFGNIEKDFKVALAVMDPAFGGDYVGTTRYLISDHDWQDIKDTGMPMNYNYNINTNDKDAFSKAMNKEAFSIIVSIDKDMFAFSYIVSMISAGVLIIVGICLIVIAFLILRFTIVFTLQEDYKEIGIMKAIGVRNFMIKKIYLVKYLVLVCLGSIIGCFISIPISNWMLESVSKSMMMENASVNFGINVICSLGVALLVLLLCYLCTNKLRTFSAIEAIRSGQTGERFRRKSVLYLHKRKGMGTPLFLAVNDILSNIKRYAVLILIFTIGTIVIILPMNAITSLKSDEMAINFALDLNADFYLNETIKDNDNVEVLDREALLKQIHTIKEDFKEKNYDLEMNTISFYSFSYYVEDEDDSYQFVTFIPLNSDGSYMELLDGTTPVNENEIALSEQVMKKLGVKIGDTIHVKIGDDDRTFIITGSYQNYIHMGQSGFISANTNVEGINSSGCWFYQCFLKNKDCNPSLLEQMSKDFPDYTIYDVQQAMDSQLGSTSSQLDNIKIMIVFLISIINMLITILMMKIFIMSEKSQIAMLRSIGYSLEAVRRWQIMRIGIVLVIGVISGAILSIPLNDIAIRPIFGMMGATHMKIQVNAIEAYLEYPLFMLGVILIAAFIGSRTIKKLNLMEINNAE